MGGDADGGDGGVVASEEEEEEEDDDDDEVHPWGETVGVAPGEIQCRALMLLTRKEDGAMS